MSKTADQLIVVTAPSGAGKTTVVRHLLATFDFLAFSVSATTRLIRDHEEEGRDYYFKTREEFEDLIERGAFVEWEEVYRGQFYGTLRSEVERIHQLGKHVIFDIDVKGAMNIKQAYPKSSLAIFIKPPDLGELARRLKKRKTETEASFKKRIKRAKLELTYENRFDRTLINDELDQALKEAEEIVRGFIFGPQE